MASSRVGSAILGFGEDYQRLLSGTRTLPCLIWIKVGRELGNFGGFGGAGWTGSLDGPSRSLLFQTATYLTRFK